VNFSKRLAIAISHSGKSKGALAKHCEVALSTVSRWLSGATPKAHAVTKIAEFLSVDANWLLAGKSENPDVAGVPEKKSGELTGQRLRLIRKRGKCSEENMARAVGLSLTDYRAIEAGIRPIPNEPKFLSEFARFAQVYLPRDGGGQRGLKVIEELMAAEAESTVDHILHDGETETLIQDAIELLQFYLNDPDYIENLGKAEAIIHEVMLYRLGLMAQ
jgi:transcriptional regulator with XRE-family HTH domain